MNEWNQNLLLLINNYYFDQVLTLINNLPKSLGSKHSRRIWGNSKTNSLNGQ